MIEEHKVTRRGRLALKKFFSKFGRICLEPQEIRDMDYDGMLLELVYAYKEKRSPNLRPSFGEFFSPDLVSRLIDTSEPIMIGPNIMEAVNTILAVYPNPIVDFYAHTNPCGGKDPWYKKIPQWASSISGTIPESFKQYISNIDRKLWHMPSTISSLCSKILPGLVRSVFDCSNLYFVATNLQMVCSATDVWVKSIAVVSLMSYFGFIDKSKMGVALIVNELIFMATKQARKGYIYLQAQDDMTEEDNEKVAQWAAVLIGGIAATCGLSASRTWSEGIGKFATNFSRTSNAWHTLLTKSCTFVLDYILWIIGKENPGCMAMRALQDLGISGEEWLTKTLKIIDPSIRDKVMLDPYKRREVAELYQQGSVIMQTLGAKKGTHPKAGAVITVWRKLNDLFSETGEVPESVRANQTPICIWLYGMPGVGKSEVAKVLAVKMATTLGISHTGDPFFVRRCRKYWDGYNGQPIIIFDDALQVKDPNSMTLFLEDWYGVMTPAPFSPEFSQITEKKKFVTPEIVILTSNEKFPVIPGITSNASFHRRRDFLIDVSLNKSLVDEGIMGPEDLRMDPEMLKVFGHLTFRQFLKSTNLTGPDQNIIKDPGLGPAMTLNQLLAAMQAPVTHLRKIRHQSAEVQVQQSDALNPLTIQKAREELLASLAPDKIIPELVGTFSQALTAQGEDSDVYIDRKRATFMISKCQYECEKLERKSINKLEEGMVALRVCEYCFKVVEMVPRTSRVGFQSPMIPGYVMTMGDEVHTNIMVDSLETFYRPQNQIGLMPPLPDRPKTEQRVENFDCGDIFQNQESWWSGLGVGMKVGVFLAAASLTLLTAYGSIVAIKNILAPETVNNKGAGIIAPIPQVASSGSVPAVRTARGVVRTVPQESCDDFIPRLKKSLVHLTFHFLDGTSSRIWALGLAERALVCPYHVTQHGDVVSVDFQLQTKLGPGPLINLANDNLNFIRIHDTDLCIVEVKTKRIPCFPNIVKRLVGKDRIGNVSRSGVLYDVSTINTTGGGQIHRLPIVPVEHSVHYPSINGGMASTLYGYKYGLEGKGKCGSILLDQRSGHIIGMHVAGAAGTGYAAILTSEFFQNMTFEISPEETNLVDGDNIEADGDFIPMGLVPQEQAASLPLSSNIQKSTCFGVIAEPSRVPCNMFTKGEKKPGIDKLRKALAKGGNPTIPWDRKDVEEVVAFFGNEIIATCKPTMTSVEIRTIEEAIVGVEGVPFMEPLKRNTSVGWPLSTLGLGSRKYHFIKYNETSLGLQVSSMRKELVELYNINHEKRLHGTIPFSVYHNFLKDERLPAGKNPRLINGCPMEQTIELRRYMLDFCSAVQTSAQPLGIAIGINVHGYDWSNLANRLLSVGNDVICGDYSGFGPSLDPDLVVACGDIIETWYELNGTPREEDRIVRRTLMENLAFSYEISKDTVYQTLCGSPSGNTYTALFNSMVNIMYVMLAWKEVFRGTTLASLTKFRELTSLSVYGDDLIQSISPFITELWNNDVLHQVFAKHGIKYTDADKGGELRKLCKLKDATFLKCHFIPHPTRGSSFYLAGLDKSMIEDVPNWIRKGHESAEDASIANSVTACELAYAWGHDYFDDIVQRLRKFWSERGKVIQIPTWTYLDQLYFGELMGIALPKGMDPLNYAWA